MPQIGPYQLTRELGAGGMGRVFHATDSRNGEAVALKLIKGRWAGDESARMRFVQEARAVSQLRHDNIVALNEFAQAKGTLYIAMEYLSGRPLTNFIPGPPALTLRRKLLIMAQSADALGYAHSLGIIHRDVKPGNIIVLNDKSPKLVDFGLAGIINAPHSTVRGGTPPYMSPEQIAARDVDGRADIWSAGVTLFELLTGRLPFRSMNDIVSGRTPTLSVQFPFAWELNLILARALAKDLGARYPTAQQLAYDLRMLSQRCGRVAVAAPNDATVIRDRDTPSSVETVTLPAVLGIPNPPLAGLRPNPDSGPAPDSSAGDPIFSQLGFKCPSRGSLDARVGRFAWGERANMLRTWRGRISKGGMAVVFAICLVLLARFPRPDAALLALVALTLPNLMMGAGITLIKGIFPVLGVPEHYPLCSGCRLWMGRARVWTRVCSSREEVFFGQSDCMAALKLRLWQEAPKLLSIYGEECQRDARSGLTSPSVQLRLTFFECRTCSHHAARLTSGELSEKRWEENAKFEEVYWGGPEVRSRPASAAARAFFAIGMEALRSLWFDHRYFAIGCPLALALMALISYAVVWVIRMAVDPTLMRKTNIISRQSSIHFGQRITKVAMTGSASLMAVATEQGRVTLRNMRSGVSQDIPKTWGQVNDLNFSPNGDVLAIGLRNLVMCDAAKFTAPRVIRSDLQDYRRIEFSPDGETLLVETGAGTIEMVDSTSGVVRFPLSISGPAAFTPNGEEIVGGASAPCIWKAANGRLLGGLPTAPLRGIAHRTPFRIVAFDRHRDVVAMADSEAVWVWNWKERFQLDAFPLPKSGAAIASVDALLFLPTGSIAFAGDMVGFWNSERVELRSWLGPPRSRLTSNLLLSSDGVNLVFGNASGDVEFWKSGLVAK